MDEVSSSAVQMCLGDRGLGQLAEGGASLAERWPQFIEDAGDCVTLGEQGGVSVEDQSCGVASSGGRCRLT